MESTTTTNHRADAKELYRADERMTSVVSYPVRCRAWGSSQYRGNCDGRLFLNLVRRLGARSVADPMMGSGTTRDVVAGLNAAEQAGVRFWGGDLQQGFDLATDPILGEFDLVWVHPPYWNMVRYSEDPRDLSSCATYSKFLQGLERCLARCHDAVRPGGHLAVLIGDMRKQGVYYPMGRDVMSLEGRLGALRSVVIKVQHNCTSDWTAYTGFKDIPIKHEFCIVFRKSAIQGGVGK